MTAFETLAAHKTLSFVIGAVLILGAAIAVFSSTKKVSPASWGWFGPVNVEKGVALRGYDPVSYRSGEPQLGKSELRAEHQGATYQFSSRDSLAEFSKNPQAFVPQFGGFCSFAMSKGFTADANPQAFALVDDQLFVFDSEGVRDSWKEAQGDNIAKGRGNWERH
jgi:YHS domain-containing protein